MELPVLKKKLCKSKCCAYKNCMERSRDQFCEVTFYSLPTKDEKRLPRWLNNAGRSDLAEVCSTKLTNIYICSKHFASKYVTRSGYLVKDAVPIFFEDIEQAPELIEKLPNVEVKPIDNVKVENKNLKKHALSQMKRIRTLELKLEKRDKCIARQKSEIRRLQRESTKKLSDDRLLEQIALRVQDYVLLFISMLLINKRGLSNEYPEEQKDLALKMHTTSPSLYRKMREDFNFSLPCARTLKNWSLKAGSFTLDGFFETFKEKVQAMESNERNCVLSFDETEMNESILLDEELRKIEGLEGFETVLSESEAGYACVFTVKGLNDEWKQPIGYVLTKHGLTKPQLDHLVNQMLDKLIDFGLTVRGIVCDQGVINYFVTE